MNKPICENCYFRMSVLSMGVNQNFCLSKQSRMNVIELTDMCGSWKDKKIKGTTSEKKALIYDSLKLTK